MATKVLPQSVSFFSISANQQNGRFGPDSTVGEFVVLFELIKTSQFAGGNGFNKLRRLIDWRRDQIGLRCF